MVKITDKTVIKIMTDPVLIDIPEDEIERLLIKCGFKKRKGQRGSHKRYKLEGVPNSFVCLSGHGKNPMTADYQVLQVRELLERLNLIEY